MMATVPHFISGLGLRKFQADGFLLTQVYTHVHMGPHNIIKQNRQCMNNVTLWCIRATIVAVDKQEVLRFLSVCL